MKITDYLLSQSSLVKTQLEKNHKLVNDLLSQKTPKISNSTKENNIYILKDDINNKELLKEENDYFIQLYAKTKKLYPTKVEETFKDLICKYRNNDYIIPDLSDKKNLFNQNPLLLVGRDLQHFYLYNDKNKKNKKNNYVIVNHKHLDFIKKEMLFMETVINKNNDIKKMGNKNLYGNNNNINNDISYKNEKINYFMVDSVWDKIKKERERQKYMRKIKLLKKKSEMAMSLNKNENKNKLQINISRDQSNIIENNKINKTTDESNIIDSYNYFNKINKINKNLKNSNDFPNYKKLNSTNTINSSIKPIKNMKSVDTFPTNISLSSETPIKKVKHNLLSINKFIGNEESIKLKKEIEEIKNTLNNSNLIQKNIILERRMKIKKKRPPAISFDNNNKSKNNKSNKSMSNQALPLFSNKKSSTILLPKNKQTQNENENENENKSKHKKRLSIQLRKVTSEEKNNNNLADKRLSIKLFEIIKKRSLPFFSLNKLVKEENPQKFLEILSKMDLKIFDRKEIEKIMKNYCYKVLNYNEKETENTININRNDENIYKIIEKVINKTKKNSIEHYGKYSLKSDLEHVNKTIYNLKKKFFLGKTDYNYEQ